MSGPTLPDLTDWRQAAPGEVIPVGVPYLCAAGNGVTVLYQGASATGATVRRHHPLQRGWQGRRFHAARPCSVCASQPV